MNQNGYTLVEVLVAVAMVGIAAVVLVAMGFAATLLYKLVVML